MTTTSTLDDRIITTVEYGVQIDLTCRNHPELHWMTKNIAPIGIRSIFYRTWKTPECACPGSDLVPTGSPA